MVSASTQDVALGVAGIANDLFSVIVEIAVDRAKREGLALVKQRIESEVCNFPSPPELPSPLLPNLCRLVRTTDLQALVGQTSALRAAVTGDALQMARSRLDAYALPLPPLRRAAAAGLSVVERAVAQSRLVLTKNDVWLIVNAFLNSSWKIEGEDITKIGGSRAVLETAVAASRVYVEAQQLRSNDQRRAADSGSQPPASAETLREVIDLAEIIRLEEANCKVVFTACPDFAKELQYSRMLGEWANLAIRAAGSFAATPDGAVTEDFRAELRSAMQLVLDALQATGETLSPESEKVVEAARRTVIHLKKQFEAIAESKESERRAAEKAYREAVTALQKVLPPNYAWVRTIALAALDGDAPHLISALAVLGAEEIERGCRNDYCRQRQKLAALLSGVSTFALSYEELPTSALAEQRVELLKARQEARKQALESVIDAATDRRNRGGDRVWSLGVGLGALFGARQKLPDVSAAAACLKDGQPSQTCTQALQFHVPLGVAWQRLPGNGFPFHVNLSFLDLGNYVGTDRSTTTKADWQAIFAPGMQAGVPLGTASNFFVVGFSATYVPHLSTTPASTIRSAWHYGGFVQYFLPLWDFN